jgi:hypothetical protein
MKKIIFTAVGIVTLSCALPLAIVLWNLLPAGRYPVILVGLPALPLVWLGFVSLRSAGWPIEEFVRRRPRTTGLLVCVLALVEWVIAVALGMF